MRSCDRAKAWLDSNIRIKEDMAPLWGDSIADFEQSLRNGYALAHLARSLGGKKGRIVLVSLGHFSSRRCADLLELKIAG